MHSFNIIFADCDYSIREYQARRIDISLFMSLLCRYILEYSNLCQGRHSSKAIGMRRKISIFTKDAKSDTT